MSKISALLKKVELFEKLAIYGNRKTLLESFAQDAISNSSNLFKKALQLANNARQEVINSWMSLPSDVKSMGYYQDIRSLQPKNTDELALMANSLNKIARDLLGRRDDAAAITAGTSINRAMGDLMSNVAQLKQYQLDLAPQDDNSEIGSSAPSNPSDSKPANVPTGPVAAGIISTLRSLMMSDRNDPKVKSQIDNAKYKLIPYLEKTLMPTLTGEEQDEYSKVVNQFKSKVL